MSRIVHTAAARLRDLRRRSTTRARRAASCALRIGSALSLGTGLWAGAAPARASAPRVDFEWSGPKQCPDSSEVRARLDEHLAAISAAGYEREVVARAQVEARGDRLELTLDLRVDEAVGQRRLHGADCELLAEVAALLTAMAVDPAAATRADPSLLDRLGEAQGAQPDDEVDPTQRATNAPDEGGADSDDATATPVNTSVEADDAPPEGGGARARRSDEGGPHWGFELGGNVGWGTLPGYELGPELGLVLQGARWHLRAFGTWAPRRSLAVPGLEDGEAEIDWDLWSVGLRASGRVGLTRWSDLLAGGGFRAGQMRARPRGVPESATASPAWLEIEVGVDWRVRMWRWLWVRVGASGHVDPLRPRFEIEGLGRVHEPSWLGVRGSMAIFFEFG